MNAFTIMRERCGLSLQEAAAVLAVRLDTVKSWGSGRRGAGGEVLHELRAFYVAVQAEGTRLALRIAALVEGRDLQKVAIGIAAATDDREAKKHGLPVAGAWHAAVGIAMVSLPEELNDLDIVVEEHGSTGPSLLLLEAKPFEDRLAPWGGRKVLAAARS